MDGAWSCWDNWATCDATCGSGTRTRSRSCDNPAPTNGGDICIGASSETSTCDVSSCPGKEERILLSYETLYYAYAHIGTLTFLCNVYEYVSKTSLQSSICNKQLNHGNSCARR